MDFVCLTPDAMYAATHPELPALEERLRHAPPGLGVLPDAPAPPGERTIYGTPYANHFETEHFTLNWADDDAFGSGASTAAAALEAAWTYFVEEKGWTPPVSSDEHYIWVLLVDDLGGTGLTTEYFTDEYPDGYPVIYLNHVWASDEAFWSTLVTHEFHHTLQYAVRDYDGAGEEETWYWEASATWAAALVEPESAALDYIVPWYGDQAGLAYTSTTGSHQYGMYVFNGWLDTVGVGPETMKAVWDRGAVEPDAGWRTLLSDTTGQEAGALWAGFAADFGNDTYLRGPAWQDPLHTDIGADGSYPGHAAELGTVYYRATEALEAEVHWLGGSEAGELTVSAPPTAGEGPWTLRAGETLAVTTTAGTLGTWSVTTRAPGADTGVPDTGDPQDSAEDTAGDGIVDGDEPGGCGCVGVPHPAAWLPVVAAWGAQAWRRRRREGPHAQ